MLSLEDVAVTMAVLRARGWYSWGENGQLGDPSRDLRCVECREETRWLQWEEEGEGAPCFPLMG